jgi:hypothetical protein
MKPVRSRMRRPCVRQRRDPSIGRRHRVAARVATEDGLTEARRARENPSAIRVDLVTQAPVIREARVIRRGRLEADRPAAARRAALTAARPAMQAHVHHAAIAHEPVVPPDGRLDRGRRRRDVQRQE